MPAPSHGDGVRSLVLSVDIGAGHRRAAEALGAALARRVPGSRAHIVEALEHVGPGARDLARDLYLGVQREIPDLWGFLYEQRGVMSLFAPISEMVDDLRSQGLRPLVRAFDPHVLVATHPIGCGLAAALRRSLPRSPPAIALLTDFDAHPAWVARGIDLYLVGSEEVRRGLIAQGVAPRDVVATGIPLRQDFASVRGRNVRGEDVGLPHGPYTLLLLGGGLGLGPVLETAAALATLQGPLQLVLIAGNNARLRAQAEELAARCPLPLHVRGHVEDMAAYMALAHLAIGKPGGLTSAELLAAGVPLVALQPLAGQEEANCAALARAGVALRADNAASARDVVKTLLGDPARYARMADAARALGRPRSAEDAATEVLRRLP